MNTVENSKCSVGDSVPAYIAQISSIRMGAWPHVGRQLHRDIYNGYVYAIGERGTNMVFIGWGGRTPLKETLSVLQKGNPRILHVLYVLQRSNVYNANDICNTVRSGFCIDNVRNGWFDIEHDRILSVFSSIDRIKMS
jgi:hypothetical protein